MDPTLSVLLYASLAAGAAGLGALPLAFRGRLPTAWIGWANAIAAGVMLGVAHALISAGMDRDATRVAVGAALGIAFVALTHRATGTGDLDLNRLDETRPEYGYQVLLVSALHAAAGQSTASPLIRIVLLPVTSSLTTKVWPAVVSMSLK